MGLQGQAPSPHRLHELVDAMAGQPVAMWVDLVADRFISGSPKRISREAPVLILSFEEEVLIPGGGANAVANVAALGGRPRVAGIVGDDTSGLELVADLERRGVDTHGILSRPGYRTPTKTRILGGGRHTVKQQIVRYDIEDQIELSADEIERLAAGVTAGPQPPRVAVVSDYGYGAATPSTLRTLRTALGPGCPILVDSRYRLEEMVGADGATPNEEEAEALLGRPFEEAGGDLEETGRALVRQLEARFLLVTRGSSGMSLFTDGPTAHIPIHGTAQVADVTGAGDTVIGTFALALAAGGSPLEAACLANFAGGVVVMKMGTATLDRQELHHAIDRDSAPLSGMSWSDRPGRAPTESRRDP